MKESLRSSTLYKTFTFLRSAAWIRTALWPMFLTLALYLVLSLFAMAGAHILNLTEGVPSFLSPEQAVSWPGIWARWDSSYYLTIARHGYSTSNGTPEFYPLYPLLVRGLAKVTLLGLGAIGTLVSVVLSGLGFVLLYRAASMDYGNSTARMVVVVMLLFPMSVFLFAVYAESLFFFLSIAVYYLARRRRWLVAGMLCLLASLTRGNGFLVSTILMAEFLIVYGWSSRAVFSAVLLGLTGVLGFLTYQAFLWNLTGNVRYSSELLSAHWKRYMTWPWVNIWDTLQFSVMGNGAQGNWFMRAVGLQELAYTALFIALAIVGWRSLRSSLLAYLVLSLGMYLSLHGPYWIGLWSMPRYVMPLFPAYIVLAEGLQRSRSLRWTYLAGSSTLLMLYTLWWGSGRWIA